MPESNDTSTRPWTESTEDRVRQNPGRYPAIERVLRDNPGKDLYTALSDELERDKRWMRRDDSRFTILMLMALILWALAYRGDVGAGTIFWAKVIAVVTVGTLVLGRIELRRNGRRWFFRGKGPFG